MLYSYRTEGVCSRLMSIGISEDGVIESLKVEGGCEGNLQGLSALVTGQSAQDVVTRLSGIRCGNKATSCPDQLARALTQILEEQAGESVR